MSSLLAYVTSAFIVQIALVGLTASSGSRVETLDSSAVEHAMELCGSADESILRGFESECTEPGEPLAPVTTSRNQGGGQRYRLPPLRLYVCHPGAKQKGVIETEEEMNDISKKALEGQLWDVGISAYQELYKKFKQLKGTRADAGATFLWVLDLGGNLIIAPEFQNGKMYKHGDLTPGSTPWQLPESSTSVANQEVSCCCKKVFPIAQCNYKLQQSDDDKETLCCKRRLGGCPWFSAYTEEESSFCGSNSETMEKGEEGMYRGPARFGGEIRIVEGSITILDLSGYSFSRKAFIDYTNLDGDPKAKDLKADVLDALEAADDISSPGVCGMRRFRKYWRDDLSWDLTGVRFGVGNFSKPNWKMDPDLLDDDTQSNLG